MQYQRTEGMNRNGNGKVGQSQVANLVHNSLRDTQGPFRNAIAF
jgi:hypothetical protein